MKLLVLFAIFTSGYSVSLMTKKLPNAHYCSVVRTKHDRADVYSRNFALKDNRWKNSTVVYELDPYLSTEELNLIKQAIYDMESQTCLRWKERTGSETPYVLITNRHGGCWAELGAPNERNMTTMNIQPGLCTARYIVTHEMLHVAGMDHEHNRPDRDNHVYIFWSRIYPGLEHNFYKDRTADSTLPYCHLNPHFYSKASCTSRFVTETFGLPYDTESIMHYDSHAFTDYNLPTIVPLDYSKKLKTNRFMSLTDLKKINSAYCDGKPFPTPGPPPCEDLNPHCEQTMYICKDNPDLAKEHCEKSCGFCKS